MVFSAIIFAVAVQIQVSLFRTEDYLGLRINLADLLLPLMGVVVLVSLLLKKTQWPEWRLRHVYIWLVVLSAVLGMALVNGYFQTGDLSRWALVNKFCGWFVLIGYFGLGGWFASNGGTAVQTRIIQAFCIFFLIVTIVHMALGLYQLFGPGLRGLPYFQLSGLMYNRNSYAFLLLTAAVLFGVFQFSDKRVIARLAPLFWLLLFIACILNGSRTLWIVGGGLLVFMGGFYRSAFLEKSFLWLAAGCALTVLLFHVTDTSLFLEGQLDRFKTVISLNEAEKVEREFYYQSEGVRLRVLGDALALWREHPLTGAGLGSFLHASEIKYADQPGTIIDLIDFTLLWLLTETGIAGALLFAAFYARMAWSLWRDSRNSLDINSHFLWAVFLILMVFGFMSILHELLYTRFLWLFLGLAMARVPEKENSP